MVKLLIVDDEDNARESIGEMVRLYCPNVELIGSADGVSSAVKLIQQKKPDVVLLDIELKDGTGFDIVKNFPSPAFKIIFITAYQQYAVEAFRFSALDYILKPVDPDLLSAAIQKAENSIDRDKIALKIDSFLYNMDNISKGMKKIVLKTADSIHLVNLQDVMYCEADRSYTNFYLSDRSRIMVSRTMGEYEEMFGGYGFMRIHQSYLVNINYIKSYQKGEGGTIIMQHEINLPVATRKKEQLLQVLAKL